MDKNANIEEYKKIAKAYVEALVELGIPVDDAYIFGSRVAGTAYAGSDLDTCIVSPVFGEDAIADRIVLMKVGRVVNDLIEPHPIASSEFASKYNPLVSEIKRYGIKVI